MKTPHATTAHVYAETFYDCAGVCLNDADGDGVCNELEIDGCTEASACNYAAEATEEDGTCEYAEAYYDCDGNCLNDADGDLVRRVGSGGLHRRCGLQLRPEPPTTTALASTQRLITTVTAIA